MDIRCVRCGEPWDYYGARHGGDMTPAEYEELRRGECCPSCKGKPAKPGSEERQEIRRMLADLLDGDDDGLASTLEDFDI